MNTNAEHPDVDLKAIEGYLAGKADHGDALARSLRTQLLKSRPELAGDGSPDHVSIEHWDSPRYGGSSVAHAGKTFTAELVDQRQGSGQLMVCIGDDNGNVDEQLSVAFEVADLPGSTAAVATLLLYDGDELMAKLVRRARDHLIIPMQPGARLTTTRLPDGQRCWVLSA